MTRMSITLALILIHLTAAAQKLPALDSYFSQVRSGKSPAVPEGVTNTKESSDVLDALSLYYKDTTTLVRSKAYSIAQQIGTQAKDQEIRQKSVQHLVSAINDPDAGNTGIVLEYLMTFKKEDFTTQAKTDLGNLLTNKPSHIDQLFKVIGFLELTNHMETIRPYTQPSNNKNNRWAAIVSLARMGDPAAIQDMMVRAKKLPVNDDVVAEIFSDLVYSRQKVALDYMVEVLKSDEKNCTSSGENSAPIACGYRIMEQLAKAVKDYPLELDASGDIKTKDYKQALIEVRAWFDKNKNYEIDRSTF